MKKTQTHLETARPCESYPNGCKKCALRQWCIKLYEEAKAGGAHP